MDADALRSLLDDVAGGRLPPDDAVAPARRLPFADLGYARVDHHRALRQGLPEAVYGPGKTPEQCAGIVAELLDRAAPARCSSPGRPPTRPRPRMAANPSGEQHGPTLVWRPAEATRPERIVIAAAGTADRPVADECATVLAAYGFTPRRLTDVGVAGMHRLLAHVDELAGADAVVVVAGMEGALASVVGGLTPAPVIAVPTSVGYGASLGGVTALLAMLSSCAAGVTVVGIDNGFGAACARRPHLRPAGRPGVTVAWFHCFSGIAGDMALGALLDAGADRADVLEMVGRLPGPSGGVSVRAVQRCGIGATQRRGGRGARPSPPPLRRGAPAGRRGRACPSGCAIAPSPSSGAWPRSKAGSTASPPTTSSSTRSGRSTPSWTSSACAPPSRCSMSTRCGRRASPWAPAPCGRSHGVLPNPAPAVVALLASVNAPTYGVDVALELTTPTGAALVTTLAAGFGPLPAMAVEAVGYGAGRRDLDGRPNVVQVVLGEETTRRDSVGVAPGQPAVLLEVNVDDATGEAVAHAIGALLDAGAHDAWVTPIVMKKGRPAYIVSALVDPALVAPAATTLTAETGSLGVRAHALERWPRARTDDAVTVDGFPVRVKIGAGRVKVEDEDAAAAARGLGLPVREVTARADAAWRAAHGSPA